MLHLQIVLIGLQRYYIFCIYKCNLLKILNYSHELFRKEFSKNELLSGQDSNLSVLSQLVLETSAVDHLATTQ